MSIWILLAGLIVIFGVLGFFLGAIRTAVTVAGLFLGLMLAGGLAPTAAKILPSVGIKSFSEVWLLSPVTVVVVIVLVFLGISFAVHAQVAKKIKSKNDDLLWLGFQRLNRQTGACAGLVAAIATFFAIGSIVYSVGYATIQLSGDTIPGSISAINTLRRDMETSGFDRAFAALDKTSPKFYQTADVLGLIYQNPILQSRINTYPPFLTLMERQEFQDIATDKEYNDLVFSKGNIALIADHPKTLGIISNPEIRAEFENADLADLKTYLKTGKSPKYDDEKILGRWLLDKDALLTHLKKSKPDMRSRELLALKQLMEKFPKVTMLATVDNKAIFKVDGTIPDPAAAPAAPVAPDPYRGRGPNRQAPPRPAAPKPSVTGVKPPPVLQLSGEGTWTAFAGEYKLTVPEGGKPVDVLAKVDQDELIITKGDQTLVFAKVE
jgi:hypothetical protein